MSANTIKALLTLIVFLIMFLLIWAMPPSYRECLASFKPQAYCAAKELSKW